MIFRAVILSLATASAALAQTGNFDLMAGAKNMGRASYTVSKAKQGYKLASRTSYHINGIESDLTTEFKLSDTYSFLEGSASSTSTQMHTSFEPNKPRTELTIGMVQGGQQDSRHLDIKPDFMVMQSYDPGAAQVMLLWATTHPAQKNVYNIVVPAGAGGAAASPDPNAAPTARPMAGNFAYDALWAKGPDAAGTLDGKPVALHTYTLTSGKNVWTFFADDANLLMQLDNSLVKASYIRSKFKLDAPQ